MELACEVKFGDENLKKAYHELESGKFEDRQLKERLDRARDDLRKNAFCGIQIPKKLFPKEYVQKYGIKNLWKYDLPKGWRLLYTVTAENEVELISAILEWFNHKDYERRFGY